MKRALCFLLVAAAFAGCADEGGPETAAAQCQETEFEDAAGVCQPHVEPTIVLSGLPDSVQQYTKVEFRWALDNGTHGQEAPVHSMDSRILVSPSEDPVDNTTGPDAWGTEVARQQHKNFPDNFTATFSWDDVGLLHVKGYMLIDAKDVWVDLGTIDVMQVAASGQSQTVTISGPPPELQDADPTITVGDAVIFDNTDPVLSYTVTFDCGLPDLQVSAGSASDAVVFLEPGQCGYTASSPLSDLQGKIQVAKP